MTSEKAFERVSSREMKRLWIGELDGSGSEVRLEHKSKLSEHDVDRWLAIVLANTARKWVRTVEQDRSARFDEAGANVERFETN